MKINEKDIEDIALMHIQPVLHPDQGLVSTASYRFFRDKIKLFLEFDPNSVILTRNNDNLISGVLVYTYDEQAFNRFCAPSHWRFWSRAFKTLIGYYGCSFAKFAKAAFSMLGRSGRKLDLNADVLDDDDYGKIWVLIVAEEERGKGIAGELLTQCVYAMKSREAKSLTVTVKTDNAPAISVYEKKGFKNIGTCEESSGHSFVMSLKFLK